MASSCPGDQQANRDCGQGNAGGGQKQTPAKLTCRRGLVFLWGGAALSRYAAHRGHTTAMLARAPFLRTACSSTRAVWFSMRVGFCSTSTLHCFAGRPEWRKRYLAVREGGRGSSGRGVLIDTGCLSCIFHDLGQAGCSWTFLSQETASFVPGWRCSLARLLH